MKKEFIGYYDPTEEEIKNAWNNSIFAFDANTLLNLYRYTSETRKDFLDILKILKNRLFLPYQAALEYHRNRKSVIFSNQNAYTELCEILKKNFDIDILEKVSKFKRHPSIIIQNIKNIQTDFINKLNVEIEKQKIKHPDFKSKDEILEDLTKLFENSLGRKFSNEELLNIYKSGKDRYAEKIPPGYMDAIPKKDKGENYIYGDLIIWKELINYSIVEKKQLIFITDDSKEDWWISENGDSSKPRAELIKEFYDLTGMRIFIYKADLFLQYAKEQKFMPKLKDKSINEIKEIRISDEKTFNNYIDFFNSKDFENNNPSNFFNPLTILSPNEFNSIKVTDYANIRSPQILDPRLVHGSVGAEYLVNNAYTLQDNSSIQNPYILDPRSVKGHSAPEYLQNNAYANPSYISIQKPQILDPRSVQGPLRADGYLQNNTYDSSNFTSIQNPQIINPLSVKVTEENISSKFNNLKVNKITDTNLSQRISSTNVNDVSISKKKNQKIKKTD